MRARQVFEFHKTGDPLGSLGVDHVANVKKEIMNEIYHEDYRGNIELNWGRLKKIYDEGDALKRMLLRDIVLKDKNYSPLGNYVPGINDRILIWYFCKEGLLKDKHINKNTYWMVINEDTSLAREWLLKQPPNKIFSIAMETLDIPMIKHAIENGATNLNIRRNKVFTVAVENNDVDFMKDLLKIPSLDPTAQTEAGIRYRRDESNYPIRHASKKGYVEIVKELLMDGRSNPSSHNNFALKHAINGDHTEIIKMLLKDKRVVEKMNLLPKPVLKKLSEILHTL